MKREVFFENRVDAGRRLAELLLEYKDSSAVVIALPRGGVVLGRVIADELHCPLDITISRKIGHPQNAEYAIGAISESGRVLGNSAELAFVDQQWLKKRIEAEKEEIRRRRQLYMHGREPLDLSGKTAILVDDGIATGSTMLVAIDEVRERKPKKIVVAVPVSPRETAELIRGKVDSLIAVDIPEVFMGAIGAYYADFEQVSDEEVIRLINGGRGESNDWEANVA